MPEPVVNSSPLIHLSRAGSLSLLQVAGTTVLVPSTVMNEIRVKGEHDVTVRAVEAAAWLKVVPTPAIPRNITIWDLGAGESAVLAWASLHPGTTAILDDRQARRCAAALQIALLGTVGIVLIAKREGLIQTARPVMEKLVARGMYLSTRVIDAALAIVGE